MKTLTIFYDAECGLCRSFRRWLEAQPRRVEVEFVDVRWAEAARRFPGLLELGADREVIVLADDGRWWQGTAAWLTCLWATHRHQEWAFRLAGPAMQPLVRKVVHLISENRLGLSQWLRLHTDAELAAEIGALPKAECANERCMTGAG